MCGVNGTQSAGRREEQERLRESGSAWEGRVGILMGYSAPEGEK